MGKFGIALYIVGLLGILCLIGHAIYTYSGSMGVAIYISVLLLAFGYSIITMD